MNPPEGQQSQGDPGAQGLRLIIQACQKLYPQQPNPLQVLIQKLRNLPCELMTFAPGYRSCEILARRAGPSRLHLYVCQPRFTS